MPINCSAQVLTGQDGSIYFRPAGTRACLEDFADFQDTANITLPADHDFRVGDPVTFSEEDGGHIDSALNTTDTFFVVAVTRTSMQVSATEGGDAIDMNGNGGIPDGAGTENSAGHINVQYAEYAAICNVENWSASLTRESIDTTTLPCGVNATTGRMAPFRTSQSGYASGEGSMTVQFTDDQTSLANRLLANSMARNQEGASVRLFISTRDDGAGEVDLDNSLYIEGPISIQGFSVSVTPEDATTAELNFSFSGQPTHLFDFD